MAPVVSWTTSFNYGADMDADLGRWNNIIHDTVRYLVFVLSKSPNPTDIRQRNRNGLTAFTCDLGVPGNLSRWWVSAHVNGGVALYARLGVEGECQVISGVDGIASAMRAWIETGMSPSPTSPTFHVRAGENGGGLGGVDDLVCFGALPKASLWRVKRSLGDAVEDLGAGEDRDSGGEEEEEPPI